MADSNYGNGHCEASREVADGGFKASEDPPYDIAQNFHLVIIFTNLRIFVKYEPIHGHNSYSTLKSNCLPYSRSIARRMLFSVRLYTADHWVREVSSSPGVWATD